MGVPGMRSTMAHKILIVDDHPATREGLARLLTDAGYDIVTSNNVPSALQLLAESPPDLLITDVRLDMYNGLHLIAMAPNPIPAIVLTGFADPSIEADARRLGAEYLVKPVAPAALLELIGRKLATAHQRGVFIQTRRASRRRLTTPVLVRVGEQLGRVLDVSESGVSLELHCTIDAELPPSLTLDVVEFGVSVPVDVVWKRRKSATTWTCGAAIVPGVEPQWRAFLDTL